MQCQQNLLGKDELIPVTVIRDPNAPSAAFPRLVEVNIEYQQVRDCSLLLEFVGWFDFVRVSLPRLQEF